MKCSHRLLLFPAQLTISSCVKGFVKQTDPSTVHARAHKYRHCSAYVCWHLGDSSTQWENAENGSWFWEGHIGSGWQWFHLGERCNIEECQMHERGRREVIGSMICAGRSVAGEHLDISDLVIPEHTSVLLDLLCRPSQNVGPHHFPHTSIFRNWACF